MRSAPAVAAAFIGYVRRFVSPVLVGFAVLFSSGCAILELEKTNRGGYLDYAVDQHWIKAGLEEHARSACLRDPGFARTPCLGLCEERSDRQLLAIRIGALTKRFLPIYSCAFDKNPLGVAGAESDPCFYYDSAMVDYSGALFDLAMVALPIDDARKLVTSLTGSVTGNPINILELLDSRCRSRGKA